MIDEILIEDLAVSPPKLWSRELLRAAVLQRIAASSKHSVQLIDEAAAELGIRRRQFYDLLEAYRERRRGRPAIGKKTGYFSIGGAKEQIIAEAINNLGAGARLTEVQDEVCRLSRLRGIEMPSQTSVRTRFGKPHCHVDLRCRLKSNCDLIADLSGLDLIVEDNRGCAPAFIFAVLDAHSSAVGQHWLFAGRPSAAELGATITSFISDRAIRNMAPVQIGIASDLADEIQSVGGALEQLIPASSSRKLVEGTAIRACFGSTLGRIGLRREPNCAAIDAVPVSVARLVVSHVVAQRNAKLKATVLMRHRPTKSRFDRLEHGLEEKFELVDDPR